MIKLIKALHQEYARSYWTLDGKERKVKRFAFFPLLMGEFREGSLINGTTCKLWWKWYWKEEVFGSGGGYYNTESYWSLIKRYPV